jgi:PQQ-like domain
MSFDLSQLFKYVRGAGTVIHRCKVAVSFPLAAGFALVGCGGGGNDPRPAPALQVDSGGVARVAAQNAPIYPEVILRPINFDPGTMHAEASDPSGLFLRSVSVSRNANGTYSLRLATNAGAPPGLIAGTANIKLCRDAGCNTPHTVPSVSVAYSVRVMGPGTQWPGDNRTALALWAGAPDWSTVQGNPGHTGYVPVRANPDQFTLRWRTAGNAVWHPLNVPKQNLVTSNGLLYVVSSDYLAGGVVYARRESDGAEAWRFDLSGISYPAANPAAVANGVVYFAAGHQSETFLFARNAADGTAVFRSLMSSQWESYYAPTIGPNGVIYANAGDVGGLYAFDPQGSQLYFSPQAQVSNWTPAVDADSVYAYTGDRLQVIDPLTGATRVTIQDPAFQNYVYDLGGAAVLGNEVLGSVFGAAYTNSILNGGAIGNALTNFRTTTGSIAWQVRGVYPTTPSYKDGVVYAVNQNPLRLEARAETDGALIWSWTPDYAGESQFVSEVLLTDSIAFVSTNYATHAIDLQTHRSVWSYPTPGKLALSANGVLYIHSSTDLIAINLR